MKTRTWLIAVAATLCSHAVAAQDLAGDWQGAIGSGAQQLRLIVHIEKGDAALWKATVLSIDQSPDRGAGMPVDAVTVQGTTVTLAIAAIRGSYEGTIAADGNSIERRPPHGRIHLLTPAVS